jgi:hypothetical protein
MTPMGSEFETRLSSLSAEQWDELNRWRPSATWEFAWEAVLAAGGEEVAIPVMRRAQYRGAPLGARALAGAEPGALARPGPGGRALPALRGAAAAGPGSTCRGSRRTPKIG